jgi:hypothetical protein
MNRTSKWVVAALALAVAAAVTAPARAEERVYRDKVKSVNAEKKTFVMADEKGKDFTYKLADDCIINRGEKGVADLKEKDDVTILYDAGLTGSTVKYVLVHTDKNKDKDLARGALKTYDDGKKELTVTEGNGKDRVFKAGDDVKVQLTGKEAKLADLKLGDKLTIVFEGKDTKTTADEIVAERK